jgi:hypothetical protein
MQFAPMLLLLTLSLSWPRFAIIFRPGIGSGLEESPLTMAASAVSVASLGLAMADQGIPIGALLVVTGVLASHLIPKTLSLVSVAIACASLAAYLQIVDRVG